MPHVDWSWDLIQKLLPIAFAMFVVILAQSAATSRAFASRYNERFSENTDLVGLGMANIGAGLSGTFVVTGSPTKTQMVDGAGGRTQLTHLTTVLVVLLVLLFLTGPLAYMPEAVLAAIVFMIGLDLIDLKGMKKIFVEARSEFWVALITTVVVVLVGVEQGIILAMVLSLLDHVRRGYRPKNSLIVAREADGWRSAPVSSPAQFEPGLMAYRFSHSMYYANAEQFSEQVLELANSADPQPGMVLYRRHRDRRRGLLGGGQAALQLRHSQGERHPSGLRDGKRGRQGPAGPLRGHRSGRGGRLLRHRR